MGFSFRASNQGSTMFTEWLVLVDSESYKWKHLPVLSESSQANEMLTKQTWK